jgi:hypothetical protein
MEKENDLVPESFTYIRYNIYYSVGLSIAAIILILISLTIKGKVWYSNFFLIAGVIFIIHGIYALIRSKYVTLDKQRKTVKVYNTPIFWARKYKYDNLFFKDKVLWSEFNGQTEEIFILHYQCRKDDFEAFVAEVNKGV